MRAFESDDDKLYALMSRNYVTDQELLVVELEVEDERE